jgi:hypothetical protein
VRDRELKRKYRVLSQTLSMHSMLAERFHRRALLVDVLLVLCAVVFCATTFASESFFAQLGLTIASAHLVLGIASILAFGASVVALSVDWKGRAARHADARKALAHVLGLFRQYRGEDGTWIEERREELHRCYTEAMANVVAVPEADFVKLKIRHERKVMLSRLASAAPGCPYWILRTVVLFRSVRRVSQLEGVFDERSD